MLYLCIHYWSAAAGLFGAVLGAASPLLIGCVIAYIINILMSFYERHFFGIDSCSRWKEMLFIPVWWVLLWGSPVSGY